MKNNAQLDTENIIALPLPPARQRAQPATRERFKILPFANARTGSKSFRVTGYKRDGTRIRENFATVQAAECRKVELQLEFLARETETAIRATKLTDTQLKIAEACFNRVDEDHQLALALDFWLQHGRPVLNQDCPRLDEAVQAFTGWLDNLKPGDDGYLREPTRRNLRLRASLFANSVPNVELDAIDADFVSDFLTQRSVSAATRDNDRRALSRFFGWCMERPRRWIKTNPARKENRTRKAAAAEPTVLTTAQCRALLDSAQREHNGDLLPYVSACLFAGLRPFEASRLTWENVNLADGEIRIPASISKVKRSRVVPIHATLAAWLKVCKGKPFRPACWRDTFDRIKEAAGFGTADPDDKTRKHLQPWPVDVMRHTAISHFFRDCESYGKTAEAFGNSEAIIKAHYQGRVSSADTKAFYALMPKGAK